jgi:protoporphyrinogen oxidase
MEQWVMRTFGEGFARHFFRPYNEKFWRRPLREMTAEWAAWSIPVPDLEDVKRGAEALSAKPFGYNTSILYPRKGGIRILPDALHGALGEDAPIRLGKRAEAVHAGSRTVRFEGGEETSFDWLVSSIPLDRLAAMIEDAPDEIREAGASLQSVAVHGVNVGIAGAHGHDSHWTYFPGDDYLFYRLGYPSNYSPAMAPEGHASITAEITRRADEDPIPDLEGKVVDELVRCGAIKRARDVVLTQTMRLDPAYVIFDPARQAALPALYDYLMRHRILPVGRYGTWNYMGMEDSILHGIQAADHLKGRAVAGG